MKTIATLAVFAAMLFSAATFASPVNINTANATEIAEALTGIGMTKANAIVAFRSSNGGFTSAEQIMQVKGIGNATYEKNKIDILVE